MRHQPGGNIWIRDSNQRCADNSSPLKAARGPASPAMRRCWRRSCARSASASCSRASPAARRAPRSSATCCCRARPSRSGPAAEAILFAAARDDHVRNTIAPALARGRWVICDRFTDSTRVYQGELGGVDDKLLRALERVTVGDLKPDLTFVLDAPVEVGMSRAEKRRGDAAERPLRERVEGVPREAARRLPHAGPDRAEPLRADRRERDAAGRRRPDLERRQQAARPGDRAGGARRRGIVTRRRCGRRRGRASPSARDPRAHRPRRGRADHARRLSLGTHAACLADRRPGRHRQGDAGLPDGAVRARASRSGGAGGAGGDVARRRGRPSGRAAHRRAGASRSPGARARRSTKRPASSSP